MAFTFNSENNSFTFNQENNSWYETDENGNIIFTSEKPTDMTNVITREVDTGETKNDPNSLRQYYTVGDGYKKDVSRKGWRVTRDARINRRKSTRDILAHPEIYGVYKRKEFKDEETRNRLLNQEYETRGQAQDVRNVYLPAMQKTTRDWYIDEIPIARTTTSKVGCRNCGTLQTVKRDGSAGVLKIPKLDVQTAYASVPVNTNMEYTAKLPVMETQYAIPWQGSEEIVTEVQEVSTPSVTTKKPTTVTHTPSTRGTKQSTPVRSKITVTPIQKESVPPQPVQKQKRVVRDPAGNIVSETYLKYGGRLNYFNFFL